MISTFTDARLHTLRFVAEVKASPHSECSVSDLTRQMRAGSDEAWNEFHRRYYLSLLRYAASRVAGADDVGEVVQQAYLRIARHLKTFADEADFWRWLACVVRCVAVDHHRGVARRTLLLEKFALWREAHNDATTALPGHDSLDSLAQEALTKLPAEDAQLLRLKYCEGWSVDQLAAAANTTSKAIENRLARLRHRLREIISRIR